jgi:acetyl esterase/lipase
MTNSVSVVRIDPELQPFISMFPSADLNDPIAARRKLAELSAKAPALDFQDMQIADRTVPATPDVPGRIYRPHGAQGAIVWVWHGSAELLGKRDNDALRPADVGEPVRVLVVHFTDDLSPPSA